MNDVVHEFFELLKNSTGFWVLAVLAVVAAGVSFVGGGRR